MVTAPSLTPLEAEGEKSVAAPIKRHERRVEVSATTVARTAHGERTVRIAGLSLHTALVLSSEPLGWPGQTLDIDLPVLGGKTMTVMAGVERNERYRDGFATVIEFVVIEQEVRTQLNDLLALLLSGERVADGRQPRCIYDVLVAYGPTGTRCAHLHEISLTGVSMRVREQMTHGLVVEVIVPTLRGGEIDLRGRVTGQRLSAEGGYVTSLDFEPLDRSQRVAVGELVADLMCR